MKKKTEARRRKTPVTPKPPVRPARPARRDPCWAEGRPCLRVALRQLSFVKLVGMRTTHKFRILNIFSLVYVSDNMLSLYVQCYVSEFLELKFMKQSDHFTNGCYCISGFQPFSSHGA